jgi:hypothetical protein
MNEHDIDDSGLTPDGAAGQELDPELCAECQGAGILSSGETCPVCEGTGKPTGRTGGG